MNDSSPQTAVSSGRWNILLMGVLVSALSACGVAPMKTVPVAAGVPSKPDAEDQVPGLVPQPVSLQRSPGHFELRDGAKLLVHGQSAEALTIARDFAARIVNEHGVHLDVHALAEGPADAAIVFTLNPGLLIPGDKSGEGYELVVAPTKITVSARTPRGLFYGAVSLSQLLPSAMNGPIPIRVPCLRIDDYPRFAWRGVMLDSARHFQSPDFIRHLLDAMAMQKLNVLHWHLTDDQGWRLQIRKYPQLTGIGAWRDPVGGDVARKDKSTGKYGGFYTQDQVREIVSYAAQRQITVMPEIEMPGHAQAAIAAYPQLGVTGKRPSVSHAWGVHTWLYNVDDSTFVFMENVLSEVVELFPSQYIHVGGDEAAKDQWQASPRIRKRIHELGLKDEAALQGYFTARIEKILSAHGRKLVGWDEILEGGLPPSATVMSWRGAQGAIDAARLGHDVVMSPSPVMYFDHLQSASHDEPPGRSDVVSLADVYAFDAVPKELDAAQTMHVLGAQANLWSEYLDTPARVEHAAFPRLAALAEALWSPPEQRNWNSFLARLPAQLQRYREAGVAYAETTAFKPVVTTAALRNSDEIKLCGSGLSLRFDGTPGVDGKPHLFRVDLMNPCWIFTGVDLATSRRANFNIGQVPYYFELWRDAKNVVPHRSASGHTELQVRMDDCKGAIVASIPVPADAVAHGIAELSTVLPVKEGHHDLCVVFGTRSGGAENHALWVIDTIKVE